MKAANFPLEGGSAILEIEVPDWIVAIVLNDSIQGVIALGGEVRFEPGFGLEELLGAWHSIFKKVIPI